MLSDKKQTPNLQTLTAYLRIKGAAQAIEFYQKAFGASVVMRLQGKGDLIMHAELQIGDSRFMLSDEFPDFNSIGPVSLKSTTFTMVLRTPDCDAALKQAESAGAKTLMPPTDMFYGERQCKLADPFGHEWLLSQHLEDVSQEEMQRRAEGLGAQDCPANKAN